VSFEQSHGVGTQDGGDFSPCSFHRRSRPGAAAGALNPCHHKEWRYYILLSVYLCEHIRHNEILPLFHRREKERRE